MAHRGHAYPVNFRRDWNFNGDISIASPIPDRWRVVIHSGITPPYPIDGSVFICLPIGFLPPDILQWQSAVQTIGGFQWQLTAQDFFFGLPDTNRIASWQLQRADKGLVAAWRPRHEDRRDPFAFVSSEASTFFLDTSVFTHGGHFHASSTDPVGY